LKSIRLEKHEVAMYSELCISENCFQFEEKFYKQTFGTSMINVLSPFIANLFMGFFEKKLKRRKIFPKTWERYVNDVFAIVLKDKINDLLAASSLELRPNMNRYNLLTKLKSMERCRF
jgi:hypothetical protein